MTTLFIDALYFAAGVCLGGAAGLAFCCYILRGRREHELKLCSMLRLASHSKGDVLTVACVMSDCTEWDEYSQLGELDREELEEAAYRVLKKFRVYIP